MVIVSEELHRVRRSRNNPRRSLEIAFLLHIRKEHKTIMIHLQDMRRQCSEGLEHSGPLKVVCLPVTACFEPLNLDRQCSEPFDLGTASHGRWEANKSEWVRRQILVSSLSYSHNYMNELTTLKGCSPGDFDRGMDRFVGMAVDLEALLSLHHGSFRSKDLHVFDRFIPPETLCGRSRVSNKGSACNLSRVGPHDRHSPLRTDLDLARALSAISCDASPSSLNNNDYSNLKNNDVVTVTHSDCSTPPPTACFSSSTSS